MHTAQTAIAAVCLLAATVCTGCGSSMQSSVATTPARHDTGHDVARGRVSFIEGYQRGCDEARQQGKPMFVFFTARWCDYCHTMADEAFNQDAIVNLSQEFICVLVDADSEPEVCRQYRVRGYPTILFLSPRGTPLNRVTGMQASSQLAMEMQAALQAVARRIDEPRTF